MKYHLGKNGPAPCKASSGDCPLGGLHSGSKDEIYGYAERVNEIVAEDNPYKAGPPEFVVYDEGEWRKKVNHTASLIEAHMETDGVMKPTKEWLDKEVNFSQVTGADHQDYNTTILDRLSGRKRRQWADALRESALTEMRKEMYERFLNKK